MADPNAEFWNKQAATYTAADGQRRSYHSPVVGLGLRVPKIAMPIRYGLLRGIKRS